MTSMVLKLTSFAEPSPLKVAILAIPIKSGDISHTRLLNFGCIWFRRDVAGG
ncbi:hypothetical protein ACE02Z_06870 [Shewanella xiamenensis]|uniref:hypothetical protein n=1 Tax=Shewanella xiamenensis TaxID=332186 RepID=UPI001C4DF7CE|nr:hypothetical protein [Shewanella xiamenensis]